MKYFKKSEFACPCCGENLISDKLTQKLDEAREIAQVPFVVNSGYRCKVHNKNEGGKENSSHLRGLACDIKAKTSSDRFAILSSLIKVGFNRIGVSDTFIHCDIDQSLPNKVIWTY